MSVWLLLTGALGLIALPALSLGRWRMLEPSEQARLNAGSLVGGVALLEAALILCAWPTVTMLLGSGSGEHFFPGGALAGWVSTALAIGVPAGAAYGLHDLRTRMQRLRAEPWVGAHFPYENIDVVVLPTDVHLALVLPGRPPQIVLSRGLTATLARDELRAVMLHELAHISLKHPRYLMVAAALYPVFGWFSPFRSSLEALEVSVECWADAVASRTEAARCATRSAILALASPALGPGIAALSAAEGIFHRLGELAADHSAEPGWRRIVPYTLVTGLFVVALLALVLRV